VQEKEINGPIYWSGLQVVPPRRAEAVLEGDEMLHREVSGGASCVCPRTAWPRGGSSSEGVGVCSPAAREAEGEADLRCLGASVPEPVREGVASAGCHGREPAR